MKRSGIFITVILALVVAATVGSIVYKTHESNVEPMSYCNVFDFAEGDIAVACPDNLSQQDSYPLIVWGNGTGCNPALYSSLIDQFTDAGYIVVVNNDCYGEDGVAEQKALDAVLKLNDKKDSSIYHKIDTNKIAACGHSLGGKKSVNLAVRDERVKAVVSIVGNSETYESSKLRVPTLFFAGEEDNVVPKDEYVMPAYNACISPSAYASLVHGQHSICMHEADIYSGYIISWLNAWLNDDKTELEAFSPVGTLANDNRWCDFQMKNF